MENGIACLLFFNKKILYEKIGKIMTDSVFWESSQDYNYLCNACLDACLDKSFQGTENLKTINTNDINSSSD